MNKPVQKFLILISFFSVFLFLIFLQISFASNESDVGFDYVIDEGELFVDIVDELTGNTVETPVVDFGEGFFSNDPITSTGILGTSQESIRVFNYTHNPTWTLNIAGEHVESKWSSNDNEYPFNHPTDENLGRLSVNPELLSLSSDVGCSTENINFGLEDSFVQGSLDSIDIASAITTASPYCRFDLQDIDLSQIVPGSQPVGTYTLGMVLTISEGYFEAPSEPQELIVSFEEDQAILEWSAPEEEGSDPIDGYMIERTDSPWSVLVANTGSTATSYTDTTITGDHHQYRVSAISRAGVGSVSDIPMYRVTYISSDGGSVVPKSRTLVGGGISSAPTVLEDSGYVLSGFEITSGEGNGNLNIETGEVTNVVGNMTVRGNFVSSDFGYDLDGYSEVIYVSSIDGNDSTGTGTQENPFQTLPKGVSHVQEGGAILLLPGEYTLTADLYVGKSVSIMSAISPVIINANYAIIHDVGSKTIKFYRIIFSHQMFTIHSANNINVHFYNCVFDSLYGRGSYGGGGFLYNSFIRHVNLYFENTVHLGSDDVTRFSSYAHGPITAHFTNVATDRVITHYVYSGRAAPVYYKTSMLEGTATFDPNYNITSGNWENAGTGQNPDGSQAHIGVYGGEFAW